MNKFKRLAFIGLITFVTLQTVNMGCHIIAREVAQLLEDEGWIHYK